jgi:hypothetical protein
VAKIIASLDALPTCTLRGGEISLEEALGRSRSSPQAARAIRGRLVPHPESCTEMDCGDGCCNTCGGSWLLASGDGARATLSMQWSVRECHVGALTARMGAGLDVVAMGTLRDVPARHDGVSTQLPNARVCVVRVVRGAR